MSPSAAHPTTTATTSTNSNSMKPFTDVKMVLLHEHKHEDGIKNFFLDVWEAYLKVSLNPFQDLNAPIENAAFDARVRAAAKKFL